MSLYIIFEGRLKGKKNQHEIHMLGNRRTIGLSREARDQRDHLKWLATVAIAEQGWVMPPHKTFLGIRYTQYCSGINAGDIDNCLTTAMDAFQGIVYENDMYVSEIAGRKIIRDKKDTSFRERTEFEIYIIQLK